MCRRNQLLGYIILGFGLGLLVGQCLESGFLCTCAGVALVFTGICGLSKK